MKLTLSTDSAARKDIPVYSGFVQYFPAAIAGAARHSKRGNDKHNPGQPLHHARGKSTDHEDCIERHLMDISDIEAALKRADIYIDKGDDSARAVIILTLLEEADALVWRAAALSQRLYETYGNAPLAPAAVLPVQTGQAKADSVDAVYRERKYNIEVAPGKFIPLDNRG
jgi:hypothetical protein